MKPIGSLLPLFAAAIFFFGARPLLAQELRPFTVADSIEMTTFSDPDIHLPGVECKRSPDGRYFVLITTRGVLGKNQIVSTAWVYSADQVSGYLLGAAGSPPAPRPLFQSIGAPVALQNNSYGSLITNAKWESNSRSVLTLVEQTDGHRHLFRIYLDGTKPIDLTPGEMDVKAFDESGGTIAYTVAEHMAPPKLVGRPIDAVSSDLTDLSIFQLLFPEIFPDPSSLRPPVDLWVRYKGSNRKVNPNGKWYFPASAVGLHLAISRDGERLIAARPVPDIPDAWSRYKLPNSVSGFDPAHTGTDRSGKAFHWPWQYIYVDLNTMTIHPLVDAPSGFLEGYVDTSEAVWSRDNQTVLFTNSYLSLSPAETNSPQIPACAAAAYQTATQEASCVAYARYPDVKESLRDATFGASSNEVVLRWFGEGKGDIEVYEKDQQDGWRLKRKVLDAKEPHSSALSLFIRQDLDVPPVLWASEADGRMSKKLWNPNPQLDSIQLGQASVYMWKDGTGYEWHAGLVLPPNFVKGRRYPLVIQTHGFYNEHEFLVDGSFTTGFAARALSAAGIVVLQMEDRADRNVQPADQESSLTIDGFESAIADLDKAGLIDPSRVGAIGFSRTAWYVEQALIQAPRLFRAATLIDGIDQSYMGYMLFTPGWPGGAAEQEAANDGKPFGPGLQSWIKKAAGFNLDRVRVPVRIEAIGPISMLGEWEIYSSLYQQGKPVDFVYIPNGQHILQKPQERYASQQGNVDWFRFWLEGYEDPDPAKQMQYERWSKRKNADSKSTGDLSGVNQLP